MDRKNGLGAGFINQLMGVLYGIHAPTNGIAIVNVVNHGKPSAINHPPDDIFYGWYFINYPQVQPTLLCFFGKLFHWTILLGHYLYTYHLLGGVFSALNCYPSRRKTGLGLF